MNDKIIKFILGLSMVLNIGLVGYIYVDIKDDSKQSIAIIAKAQTAIQDAKEKLSSFKQIGQVPNEELLFNLEALETQLNSAMEVQK